MEELKDSLKAYLNSHGLGGVFKQNNIFEAWDSVVGESIKKNTNIIGVYNKILKIKTTSPVWRNELSLQKQEIIENLNRKLEEKIKDIRFV
jgi:hypothetical protein